MNRRWSILVAGVLTATLTLARPPDRDGPDRRRGPENDRRPPQAERPKRPPQAERPKRPRPEPERPKEPPRRKHEKSRAFWGGVVGGLIGAAVSRPEPPPPPPQTTTVVVQPRTRRVWVPEKYIYETVDGVTTRTFVPGHYEEVPY